MKIINNSPLEFSPFGQKGRGSKKGKIFSKNKKMRNKKAFTLVELIVVITILAILATIGFVWYSQYLVWTRDSNRISQLKSISEALNLYKTKRNADLPIPEDNIEIRANGEVLWYQWTAWKNIIEQIWYSTEWVDPKDSTYFSYYLTKNKRYFQLMALLEDSDWLQNKAPTKITNIIDNVYASDYEGRYPAVFWDKLWILLDEVNTPVQEISSLTSSGYLDIELTNDTYKWILEDWFELTWTWSELKILAWTALAGWVRNSCKTILKKSPKIKWKDWYYLINQRLPTKVYCDMTTNGWGWSRYINIKWNYSFDDAKKCWLSNRNWENTWNTIECFNPNRLNFIVSELMIKEDVDWDWDKESNETWFKKFKDNYPSQIKKIASWSRKCRWWEEYMTVMAGSAAYPDETLTNVQRIRLWLSFCNPDSPYREVWWRNNGTVFMNYSNVASWYWPPPWNRENSAKDTEIFVR